MLTDTVARMAFVASGDSGSFQWTHPVFDAAALGLYAVDSEGEIYTPSYTVTVASDRSGATVAVATGLTSGDDVIVYRQPLRKQAEPLGTGGAMPLPKIERSLDRLTADVAALYEMAKRSLRFPIADGDAAPELGTASKRAGQALAFDNDGNPTLRGDAIDPDLITPGAFWQSTLLIATAALSRTALDVYSKSEVDAQIAALQADMAALGLPQTGDMMLTLDTVARTGWVKVNDGTLSKAGAGGTTRANADCQNLYVFCYTRFSNALCPVSGGRSGSGTSEAEALADFGSGKTLTLTKMLGRAIVIAGTASDGSTARTHGGIAGAETVAVPIKNHTHPYNAPANGTTGVASTFIGEGGTSDTFLKSVGTTSGTTSSAGDGASPTVSTAQPQFHVNLLLKL